MNLARALVFVLLSPLFIIAQTIGTITLREAPVRLIRGATIFQGAEGVRLRPGDILETSDKGFVQLEFTDGRIVAVGNASRVMLPARASQGHEVLLLSGWLKGTTSTSATPDSYASPRLAASTKGGTVLVHSSADSSEVYFESGPGTVSQVSAEGSRISPAPAKQGQFFTRRPGKNVVTATRPDAAFIDGMPVPFRDTLPSRLARFAKAVEPKADREVNYADVDAWLRTGIVWRRGFAERFRSRLRDANFRKEIEAHLNSYPEWEPILYPDEDQPAKPPAAAESSTPRGR